MLYFFFNDTATTEIYTLSLHDALPISEEAVQQRLAQETIIKQNKQTKKRRKGVETLGNGNPEIVTTESDKDGQHTLARRSEEHTSELQSRQYLVCRLLLEKKKQQTDYN